MRKTIESWKKNWFLIDIIGFIIGIGLIILYLLKSNNVDTKIQDVWSNLATEIVGVWLSVRIIDRVLENRNRKNKARLHLLRNLRHFLNIAHNILTYQSIKKIDLENLEKEQNWFNMRWEKRKKFLFDSEIENVLKLEDLKSQIIIEANFLLESYKNTKEENKMDKKKIEKLIREYDMILEELRIDIWEESHPDD